MLSLHPSLPSPSLCSGFVPKIGDTGYWAFTRYFSRSMHAMELVDGRGLSPTTFDKLIFFEAFKGPWWPGDIPLLYGFYAGTLLIAYFLLLLLNRDKQR